jgi:hypothetical protein
MPSKIIKILVQKKYFYRLYTTVFKDFFDWFCTLMRTELLCPPHHFGGAGAATQCGSGSDIDVQPKKDATNSIISCTSLSDFHYLYLIIYW